MCVCVCECTRASADQEELQALLACLLPSVGAPSTLQVIYLAHLPSG